MKTESGITEQLKVEVKEKLGKIKVQTKTLYEHPWLNLAQGFLYEANREVHKQAHWVAMALTFKFVFQCVTHDVIGAALTGTLVAMCLHTG